MAPTIETLETADAVVDHLVDLVEGAGSELAITVPPGTLAPLRAPLRRTLDDGVLVLLLATGYDAVEDADLAGLATVARRWEGHAPLICAADGERGLFAPGPFVAGERADRPATAVADASLVHALFGGFLGNYWLAGSERHAADPAPLPASFENFRHAVVQATLRLRRRDRFRARVEGRPLAGDGPAAVTGDVVNARQSFVHPVTSSFPAETSLGVRTDDGLVTVGGWGAFVEDYEAQSVTLQAADG